MSRTSADCNLLFGILAVQLDFITKDVLIEGMNTWLLDKSKSLGAILRDSGRLSAERLQLLTALVSEHLHQHDDNPEQSLAALSFIDSTLKQHLAALPDADVQATLVHVGSERSGVTNNFQSSTSPATVRYRILKPHARGGLGEVFVAEDTELGRKVALKEIQPRYADDTTSRSRFVLEAEITGGLEHPGIVPVYGLGSYADGRPYYAMRFIKGDNLGEAIRRFHGARAPAEPARDENGASLPPLRAPNNHSLEFRQLLQRFIDVCNAVAYAHSRGVLHRDLKPGNIMVGKYGETLVVDWGLAKSANLQRTENGFDETLLAPRSSGDSSATIAGSAMGTPAYMPPEQAAGDWDKLGPQSDVYSLGATLYELLTGRKPFESKMVDVVLQDVRSGRFLAPIHAVSSVPSALNAVCLKAMALKPANRYASPMELAKEVECWLADEPVTALRETITAQARRWARKHSRLSTGIAAALVVSVCGFGLGLYLVNAERGRTELARQDEEKQRVEAQNERDRANENLAYAKKGNELLGSVFDGLNPRKIAESGRPLQDVLKDNLAIAVRTLEGAAIGDPLAVADMQTTLGISLLNLGEYRQSAAVFEKANKTREATLGSEHPDTLKGMNNLAASYTALGRHAEALALNEKSLKLSKTKLGPDHPDTLMRMNNLAGSYRNVGRHAESLALNEETLKLRKAKFGPDHPDTLMSMSNLANSYSDFDRRAESLALNEETLKLRKAKFGPDHPDTLTSMHNLASSYSRSGRYEEALALEEEALKLSKAKLGPDHPDTLDTMYNLAISYAALGRHSEALALREETLKLRKSKLGPDHRQTLRAMMGLADSYAALGRLAEALAVNEETLKIQKAKLGPDHRDTLITMNNVAENYVTVGRADDALVLIDDTLPRAIGRPGVHPGLVPALFDSRLRAMAKKHDAAGCRATAEMWEKLNRTDANSLFKAASFRAVCAAVMREKNEANADEQANQAMDWLKKAVAAGYKNIDSMKKDKNLDVLRERADFKKLISELASNSTEQKRP